MRNRIFDQMQVYPFWVIDLVIPWKTTPAFLPILGFNSCTSPEISAESKEIRAGNEVFPYHVLTGGTISPLTLSRGAMWFGRDMYRWFETALEGKRKTRRDLMLIHYLTRTVPDFGNFGMDDISDTVLATALVGALGGVSAGELKGSHLGWSAAAGLATAGIAKGAGAGLEMFMQAVGIGGAGVGEMAPRIPGRAWILHKCLPTRYKAGSDFDAMSGDVSIQELELQPHKITELSLG